MEQSRMLKTIGDMVIFESVARAGSFTLGGKRLGLPKATVSRRLTQLERRVGTRLIVRSTRKISLTQEGEVFLKYCERLVSESDSALRFSEQLVGKPRGILRITMPAGFASLVLADVIESFARKHPDVVLEIDETSAVVNLVEDKIDIAFRAGELQDSSLVSRALPLFKAGLYASPKLLSKTYRLDTLADLQKMKFIGLGRSDQPQKITLTSGERQAQPSLTPSIMVSTAPTQIALALRGVGFIFSLERACQNYVEHKELVRIFPEWTGRFAEMHLLTPYKTLLPRKTELFIKHVFDHLRDQA
jgi:DNA-binding transcriptional LysR family regulator